MSRRSTRWTSTPAAKRSASPASRAARAMPVYLARWAAARVRLGHVSRRPRRRGQQADASKRTARARRMCASSTGSRSAAGIDGSMSARPASSSSRSTTDGLPAGPARDLLLGTKLAAQPRGSPAARRTPAKKSRSSSRPTTSSIVFAATTNRNAAAYSFTDSAAVRRRPRGRRAAPAHRGPARLVAPTLHAGRPHAAGA